jgi:uncharacterized radical SAM superfamily Fe-S cluster-containing enzyme
MHDPVKYAERAQAPAAGVMWGEMRWGCRPREFAVDNPKKLAFLSFQPVSFTGRDEEVSEERRSDTWAFISIAGMRFQGLWTYDFRRTEMCIIPCGTEAGEISFCACNTGIARTAREEKL